MAVEEFYQLKPPPSQASLEPEAGRVRSGAVLLKAGVPSLVTLRGSRWLRFHGFTLHVRARLLERNMAKPEFGTSSSTEEGKVTFLLAGPTRLERFGVWYRPDTPLMGSVTFSYEDHGKDATFSRPTGPTDLWGTNRYYGCLVERVALTDKVTVTLPHPMARIVLSSPSLPSRIGIGIGDDTPVQVLAAQLEAGTDSSNIVGQPETCATRDLAGPLNAAWQRVAAQAPGQDTIEVPLRLTSATDGVVLLEMAGAWDRFHADPEMPLTLEPLDEAGIGCQWPLPPGPAAQLAVQVSGRFTGGIRLGLTEPDSPAFAVRTTQQLEVAQALLPAAEPAAREVSAVWLRLPAPLAAEQKLQLRLAPAAEKEPGPAEKPIAVLDTALPADANAYRPARGGGVWFRAPFPKPLPLDGAQMTRPLYVVASAAHGEGVLLSHAHAGAPGVQAGQMPAGPGKAGCALVRNLARKGAWEPQAFHRTPNRWLVDLELVPLESEYGSLVTVVLGGQALPVPAGPGGQIAGVLAWQVSQKPPGGTLSLMVQTRAGTELTVQPALVQR